MKKRVLSLLLVCSMILSMFAGLSVTAFAADPEDGQSAEVSAPAAEETGEPEGSGEPIEENQTEEPAAPTGVSTYALSDFIVEDGMITSYNGDGGDVVIPETINGETITGIGDYAFDYDEISTLVTSVVIPATVETIGTLVFNGQVTLESVTFLGRCEEVGYYVFNDCNSLEIYCQPEDVAYYTSLFSEEDTELTFKSLCTHEWETEGTVTKAPTCVEKGTMTVACKRCGETTTVDVDPLGHEYDETNTCTRCGERKPCDETSHVWNDGEVTLDPTCIAEGVKTFTCTVCGATKTEPVEKADHT